MLNEVAIDESKLFDRFMCSKRIDAILKAIEPAHEDPGIGVSQNELSVEIFNVR